MRYGVRLPHRDGHPIWLRAGFSGGDWISEDLNDAHAKAQSMRDSNKDKAWYVGKYWVEEYIGGD